jgi:hypothetical protein
MKPGTVQQLVVSLLLALAICGAGVSSTWDFWDFHDGHVLHIDHASPHDSDMDNVKNKQLIHPAIPVTPYVSPTPERVAFFRRPMPVLLTYIRSDFTLSFPSRAPPA